MKLDPNGTRPAEYLEQMIFSGKVQFSVKEVMGIVKQKSWQHSTDCLAFDEAVVEKGKKIKQECVKFLLWAKAPASIDYLFMREDIPQLRISNEAWDLMIQNLPN